METTNFRTFQFRIFSTLGNPVSKTKASERMLKLYVGLMPLC